MIIVDGLKPLNNIEGTKLALGKFDGVHLGHRRLILEMTEKQDGLKSVVFTFAASSPISFATEGHIYSDEERRSIFEALGVDILVEYYLDEAASLMEPEEFLREVLVKRLRARAIYCGPDLSFGRKGAGNIALIESLKDELGIELHVIKKEQFAGEDISSTRIRTALNNGQKDSADAMLGRDLLLLHNTENQ